MSKILVPLRSTTLHFNDTVFEQIEFSSSDQGFSVYCKEKKIKHTNTIITRDIVFTAQCVISNFSKGKKKTQRKNQESINSYSFDNQHDTDQLCCIFYLYLTNQRSYMRQIYYYPLILLTRKLFRQLMQVILLTKESSITKGRSLQFLDFYLETYS